MTIIKLLTAGILLSMYASTGYAIIGILGLVALLSAANDLIWFLVRMLQTFQGFGKNNSGHKTKRSHGPWRSGR